MLSRAGLMFRKLRGRGSHGNEPAPSSALATTTESEPVDPPPHAIHMSEVSRSPTKLPRKPGSDQQFMTIIVANAKGAAGYSDLYRVRTHPAQCNVAARTLTLAGPELTLPRARGPL